MSNYLAVAAVTASLQSMLERCFPDDLSNGEVKVQRPEKVQSDGQPTPMVNIYLYQVIPNSSRRNEDLATRREGLFVQRPKVAMDLYYLISFYGDETELVPQRLLGAMVSAIHTNPFLDRKLVERTIKSRPFLAQSDLDQHVSEIRFSPMTMNLEEFSRVWSGFFPSVPYALSVIYKASVVTIDAEVSTVGATRVTDRDISANSKESP